MFRKLLFIFVLCFITITLACSFSKSAVCPEEECSAWNQEMFNELVTFVYNNGEDVGAAYGTEVYNISLQLDTSAIPDMEDDDFALLGHLGLYDFDSYVVLIVEAIVHDEEGNKVIDHNFYTCYFLPEKGVYNYLPNVITGNIVVTGDGGEILDYKSKGSQEFSLEGYEDEEWLWWMGIFYEYMQTKMGSGRSI